MSLGGIETVGATKSSRCRWRCTYPQAPVHKFWITCGEIVNSLLTPCGTPDVAIEVGTDHKNLLTSPFSGVTIRAVCEPEAFAWRSDIVMKTSGILWV